MTDRECAMTSRTNRQSEGRNQGDPIEGSPGDLEQRRQHAVKRYLAGDPIEVICQEMSCSKSWLYKWKNRYQAAEPTWSQERSRRPETSPGKTPAAIEAEIVRLRQTLSPDGSGTVSARVIRDHLRHLPTVSMPSLRTIYRILHRQTAPGGDLTCS
jgi:transposase